MLRDLGKPVPFWVLACTRQVPGFVVSCVSRRLPLASPQTNVTPVMQHAVHVLHILSLALSIPVDLPIDPSRPRGAHQARRPNQTSIGTFWAGTRTTSFISGELTGQPHLWYRDPE